MKQARATALSADCLDKETALNLPIGIVEKYYYAELGRAVYMLLHH